MRRVMAAAVLLFASASLMGQMQFHGVPASVTSPTPDGRFHGVPASVTSPTFNPQTNFHNPNGIRINSFPVRRPFRDFRHRNAFVPIYVPVYSYPYIYPDSGFGYGDPPSPYTVEQGPQYQPAAAQPAPQPVIIREIYHDAPAAKANDEDPLPAKGNSANSGTEAAKPAPEDDLPLTAFVFRDGHKIELRNYAIVGAKLIDISSPLAMKKYALADIDYAATRKINDDRGIELHLPAL